MQRFEKPSIEGVVLPDPVLPWEPSKRTQILGNPEDGLLWQTLRLHGRDSGEFAKAVQYKNWLQSHFLLDGGATDATVGGLQLVGRPDIAPLVINGDDNKPLAYQRLEKVLGLDEFDRSECPGYTNFAGFENGRYPTIAIANALGITSNTLLEFVENGSDKELPWTAAKIGSIVAPVRTDRSKEILVISGPIELTDMGETIFDLMLRAYEHGLNDNQPV